LSSPVAAVSVSSASVMASRRSSPMAGGYTGTTGLGAPPGRLAQAATVRDRGRPTSVTIAGRWRVPVAGCTKS
jgi:hypothetical protein